MIKKEEHAYEYISGNLGRQRCQPCGYSYINERLGRDRRQTVDFFGREVLMMNVGGSPRAIMNIYMHLGGPMTRQADKLVCEWQGAEFQCGEGMCLKGPARPDSR